MKQEEMSPADLAKLTVLYTVPGMEEVTIRRDVTYRTTESGPLAMDVYYPPDAAAGSPLPAVSSCMDTRTPASLTSSDERSRRWAPRCPGRG